MLLAKKAAGRHGTGTTSAHVPASHENKDEMNPDSEDEVEISITQMDVDSEFQGHTTGFSASLAQLGVSTPAKSSRTNQTLATSLASISVDLHTQEKMDVAELLAGSIHITFDPYVDDIQYIASREVPLERDGSLSMSKIGFGMPGDKFIIVSREAELPIGLQQLDNATPLISTAYPTSDIIEPYFIQTMTSRKDGPHPILTLVEVRDYKSGSKRHERRMDARDRDEQLAYLKGLVTQAWNLVAPVSPSVPSSQVTSLGSQCQALDSISIIPKDLQPGNASSVSSCVADRGNTSRLVHRHQTAKIAD